MMLKVAPLLLFTAALDPVLAGQTEREKCEERSECPLDSAGCLARCALGNGILPSLRAIHIMGYIRSCAAKYCSHTFPDPKKCTNHDIEGLLKVATDCQGTHYDACSDTCARGIGKNGTQESWFHCQHSREFRSKYKDEALILAVAVRSCQRFVTPGCSDYLKWKDPDGDTCISYVKKGVCRDGELLVTEQDLRRGCSVGECKDALYGKFANEACCECGGGHNTNDCQTPEALNCTKEYIDSGCGPLVTLVRGRVYQVFSEGLCRAAGSNVEDSDDDEHGSSSNPLLLPKHAVSLKSCKQLGWSNAKMFREIVKFTDSDGDTNTIYNSAHTQNTESIVRQWYVQTEKGLEAYVAKGEFGVKMHEGLVAKFKYDKAKRAEEKREEVLHSLARLAAANNVSGLELYKPPSLSCMSGIKCGQDMVYRSANGFCQTNGARMCSPKEVLMLNDKKECPIKKGEIVWTGEVCQNGTHLAVEFGLQSEIVAASKARCVKKGQKVEALKGSYDYQSGKLVLHPLGWAYDQSQKMSRGNGLAALDGIFHRQNKTYIGKHNLCEDELGVFRFNDNSVESEVEMGGGYSWLKKGECRCHNGGSPSYVDLYSHREGADGKISSSQCASKCTELGVSCRSLAYDPKSGFCRLYVHIGQRREMFQGPEFRNLHDHDDNDRCEIVKTVQSPSNNASCYLKEGASVHAPYRFYGATASPLLVCADENCHDTLSACEWDDQCLSMLVCLASNTSCAESGSRKECLKNCQDFVAANRKKGDGGESREVKELVHCLQINSCTRERGVDVDDEDIDIMPHHLRVGFPIHNTEEVAQALKENATKIDFQAEFLSSIAEALGEDVSRFKFIKYEENTKRDRVMLVFDILEGDWDKGGGRVTGEAVQSPSMDFDQQEIITQGAMAGWRMMSPGHLPVLTGNNRDGNGAAGLAQGILGALIGATMVLITLCAFVRYNRESFLRQFLGLRMHKGVRAGESNRMEMQRLAAEFDSKYPMTSPMTQDGLDDNYDGGYHGGRTSSARRR
eukprot:jgi/Bigna1/86781/estExt_fgenesh1_pg.C_130235